MGPEDDNFEDCQQAEKAQIIEHPISDDERRRFIALDHAIRISDGAHDSGGILKNARAFEAYLRGESE